MGPVRDLACSMPYSLALHDYHGQSFACHRPCPATALRPQLANQAKLLDEKSGQLETLQQKFVAQPSVVEEAQRLAAEQVGNKISSGNHTGALFLTA